MVTGLHRGVWPTPSAGTCADSRLGGACAATRGVARMTAETKVSTHEFLRIADFILNIVSPNGFCQGYFRSGQPAKMLFVRASEEAGAPRCAFTSRMHQSHSRAPPPGGQYFPIMVPMTVVE